jgi:hypothetical protein
LKAGHGHLLVTPLFFGKSPQLLFNVMLGKERGEREERKRKRNRKRGKKEKKK